MCWKIELLDKRMVLGAIVPKIVSQMMQFQQFHQHQIEVNPFLCGNLRRVQPTLRHLIDFITIQHQVRCKSVMLVKKDVFVLNGQKLVQGMQVHKKLMLKIMSECIAAHHLLCLFVQLAIDKNQRLIDEKNVQEQRFVQLVCEQTKKQRPDIILHDSGVLVAQTIYGFDSSVMKKIEKFLREQKPELLHHQKFLENGTAERAKESGTEQNYNMIDGCVNNNPKKPRIIGNRISVLDRLHIKLEERKQKSQPQQQQRQERSRKN